MASNKKHIVDFGEWNETEIICPHCSRSINDNDFKYESLDSNGIEIRCRFCDKLYRCHGFVYFITDKVE
jgi:phage FluMu protein Com